MIISFIRFKNKYCNRHVKIIALSNFSICHRFSLIRPPDPQTTGMQVHKTRAVSSEAYFCPADGSDVLKPERATEYGSEHIPPPLHPCFCTEEHRRWAFHVPCARRDPALPGKRIAFRGTPA